MKEVYEQEYKGFSIQLVRNLNWGMSKRVLGGVKVENLISSGWQDQPNPEGVR